MIKIIFSSFFLLFGGFLKSYTEILRPWAFLGNKLVFPQLESVLPMTAVNEWSLPALISTLLQAFYYILSPLSSWGGVWWGGFGGHLASSQDQISTVEHHNPVQVLCHNFAHYCKDVGLLFKQVQENEMKYMQKHFL